jgi:citronellol/citronellal dehydrogenase
MFARHGRVDLLVNSAGGQFPQAAVDFTDKGWRAVIDTNLTGTFNMVQSVGRHWHAAGSEGSVVSIVVSPRGLHQVAHSSAARAGVAALSEALAVEWAPLGIRLNCIAPGAIASEGWAVYRGDIPQRYAQASPLRRAGTPWEVAEAVIFVGGPAGRFITGQTLHVNGGTNLWGETWTAGKPAWFSEASRAWDAP